MLRQLLKVSEEGGDWELEFRRSSSGRTKGFILRTGLKRGASEAQSFFDSTPEAKPFFNNASEAQLFLVYNHNDSISSINNLKGFLEKIVASPENLKEVLDFVNQHSG